MSWFGDNWKDLLDLGLTLWGAKEQKDNLDDMPQLDLEQLRQMIFQNSRSPYGSYTWEEGDDGSMTGTYAFSPESQAAFDRISQRAQTADQAYQMPSGVTALTDALLGRRLASLGLPADAMSSRGQRQPQSFESVQSEPVTSGQVTSPAGGGIPPRDNPINPDKVDPNDLGNPVRDTNSGYIKGRHGMGTNWGRPSMPGNHGMSGSDAYPFLLGALGTATGVPIGGAMKLYDKLFGGSNYWDAPGLPGNQMGHNEAVDYVNNLFRNTEGYNPLQRNRTAFGSLRGPAGSNMGIVGYSGVLNFPTRITRGK